LLHDRFCDEGRKVGYVQIPGDVQLIVVEANTALDEQSLEMRLVAAQVLKVFGVLQRELERSHSVIETDYAYASG